MTGERAGRGIHRHRLPGPRVGSILSGDPPVPPGAFQKMGNRRPLRAEILPFAFWSLPGESGTWEAREVPPLTERSWTSPSCRPCAGCASGSRWILEWGPRETPLQTRAGVRAVWSGDHGQGDPTADTVGREGCLGAGGRPVFRPRGLVETTEQGQGRGRAWLWSGGQSRAPLVCHPSSASGRQEAPRAAAPCLREPPGSCSRLAAHLSLSMQLGGSLWNPNLVMFPCSEPPMAPLAPRRAPAREDTPGTMSSGPGHARCPQPRLTDPPTT